MAEVEEKYMLKKTKQQDGNRSPKEEGPVHL